MTIIEQIKAEIERLKTVQLKRIQEGDLVDAEPYDKNEAYNELLSFLETLESEKPINQDEDLNKEIKAFVNKYGYEKSEDILLIAIVARHFAQWQKEQMMQEAVSFYEILKAVPPGPERDKVKIIIVKEDEK